MIDEFDRICVTMMCHKHGIKNYKINEDLSIDVVGPVGFDSTNITQIPIKFNEVTGQFFLRNNPNLLTLKNAPNKCGNFQCFYNPELMDTNDEPKQFDYISYFDNPKSNKQDGTTAIKQDGTTAIFPQPAKYINIKCAITKDNP